MINLLFYFLLVLDVKFTIYFLLKVKNDYWTFFVNEIEKFILKSNENNLNFIWILKKSLTFLLIGNFILNSYIALLTLKLIVAFIHFI